MRYRYYEPLRLGYIFIICHVGIVPIAPHVTLLDFTSLSQLHPQTPPHFTLPHITPSLHIIPPHFNSPHLLTSHTSICLLPSNLHQSNSFTSPTHSLKFFQLHLTSSHPTLDLHIFSYISKVKILLYSHVLPTLLRMARSKSRTNAPR